MSHIGGGGIISCSDFAWAIFAGKFLLILSKHITHHILN